MANSFVGRGNLGAEPEMRFVKAAGNETTKVLNLRVFFDRPIPDGAGGFKDQGGFWLDVSYWGNNAERIATVLQKGMRILVTGSLRLNSWQDKQTGEEKSNLQLNAERIDLDLGRVEQVVLVQRQQSEPQQAPSNQDSYSQPVVVNQQQDTQQQAQFDSDGIPF